MALYPEYSPWELGPHYAEHVAAMTAEGLRDKSDIAVQLAWRDKLIKHLSERVERFDGALAKMVAIIERVAPGAASPWVSVAERMPEPWDKVVLVWDAEDRGCAEAYVSGFRESGKPVWLSDVRGSLVAFETVTHWAELNPPSAGVKP